MCAAKVEILANHVIAKYNDKILGIGSMVYELRDWDGFLDVDHAEYLEPAQPPDVDVSYLNLEFGEDIGNGWVRTKKYDTLVRIDRFCGKTFANLGSDRRLHREETLIYESKSSDGEEYPLFPVDIVDRDGNSLVRVTHYRSINQEQ